MKVSKNLALIALGAGAVLAYQRFNKPIKRKMDKVVNRTINKANDKLENIM